MHPPALHEEDGCCGLFRPFCNPAGLHLSNHGTHARADGVDFADLWHSKYTDIVLNDLAALPAVSVCYPDPAGHHHQDGHSLRCNNSKDGNIGEFHEDDNEHCNNVKDDSDDETANKEDDPDEEENSINGGSEDDEDQDNDVDDDYHGDTSSNSSGNDNIAPNSINHKHRKQAVRWTQEEVQSLLRNAEKCFSSETLTKDSTGRPVTLDKIWRLVGKHMQEEGLVLTRRAPHALQQKFWCLHRSFKQIKAWDILHHKRASMGHVIKKGGRKGEDGLINHALSRFDMPYASMNPRQRGARKLPKAFDHWLYDGLQRFFDTTGMDDGVGKEVFGRLAVSRVWTGFHGISSDIILEM